MWKHKNFINLQLCAPPQPYTYYVKVDNVEYLVQGGDEVNPLYTWEECASNNTEKYTIANGKIIWTTGGVLQYNGVDVLPTADILTVTSGHVYTTRAAAFDGKINITKSAGVVLKTQGKYCDKDITVVPVLEEKSVTPTESAQEIVPSDGHCGISKLDVGAVQTETKTITPTTSQQTFTPTSGKYFKQIICQAIQAYQGSATPAQGEQTINPTSGKYFSSFKVGAIPSDYIIPSGTEQITANGVYDVSTKANVNVNVPSGVEEVATAAAMDALLVEANVGKYYKFTGTTDANYTNGDLYLVEGGASSETWLLNSTLTDVLRMYYAFDSTASESAVENGSGNRFTANFESNGKTYYFIGTDKSGAPNRGATDYADLVYESSSFKNEAYRTITFDSPVTDTALLTWLQANGTKQ